MNTLNNYFFSFLNFHNVIFSAFFSSITRAAQNITRNSVNVSCFENNIIIYISAVSVKKLRHNECKSRTINCEHILFILQCVNEEKITLKRKAVFSSVENKTSNVLIVPVLIWYRALSIHQYSTLLV